MYPRFNMKHSIETVEVSGFYLKERETVDSSESYGDVVTMATYPYHLPRSLRLRSPRLCGDVSWTDSAVRSRLNR